MLANIITPRSRQVFTACSVGLVQMAMMISWAFPSTSLPQMELPDSSIQFTSEQSSWFATLSFLMLIPGSLIGSSGYEWAGPRRAFLFSIPLLCTSIMSMSLASWNLVQNAGMAEVLLLTSRVIQACIVAFLVPFISVYIYEICDQHLRGTLISLTEFFATAGFVACYLSGCFITWETAAIFLPLVTLVPAFIGIFLSQESPLWLARKGKENKASMILALLRCTKEEISSDLKTAIKDIQDKKPSCSESLQILRKKSNALAITSSCCMMIAKELCGFAILTIYVVQIFQATGVGIDPKWSSVIVGFARLICNFFGSFVMHKVRRRLIFVVGSTLMGLSASGIATFFYLQSQGEDVSYLLWLPLSAFVVNMIGYAGGVGPCTWTGAVEVLPGPVRAVGTGIFLTVYATCAFVITKSYPTIKDSIGLHGLFCLFTGGCLCYILLAIFFIPETKGKSIQDVEDYWVNVAKKRRKPIHV